MRQLSEKAPPLQQPNVKAYIVLGFALLLVILTAADVGAVIIVNLAGFVFPAYASFLAIRSTNKEEDTQWLAYWVIYTLFIVLESLTDLFVEYIPLYHLLKLVFLIWLWFPQTQGATLLAQKVL
ncbi:MAG: HVA22/TB2/DP1 family protein, partial [archaeon]|nr:HVA22/TB2/DP1 family protein [archaeon]